MSPTVTQRRSPVGGPVEPKKVRPNAIPPTPLPTPNGPLDTFEAGAEGFAALRSTVDLRDPALMKAHQGDYHYVSDPKSHLYANGVGANDVLQGAAGDCYLLAAMGAVAKARPGAIKNAIRANADGTFTVTFKKRGVDGKVTPVKVRVDRELAGPRNDRLYAEEGRSGHELWAPIIEKAFAQWKGGFEKTGNGGWPADALTAITGKAAQTLWLNGTAKNPFGQLKKALAAGKAMTASTDKGGEGIVGAHAYTVLGAFEKDGKKFVRLRNPWGFQEYGHDRKNDGSFVIPFAKFDKYFQEASWV